MSKNGSGKRPIERRTAVRNTPIPRATATPVASGAASGPRPVASKPVTHEMIAHRAYLISQSQTSGSPQDNWYRAERELRSPAR